MPTHSATPTPSPARGARPALGLALCAAAFLLGSGAALAQDGKPTRNDSVAVRSRRGDNVSQVPGVVKTNTLEDVVVTTGGKDEKFSTEFVLGVTFGDVPTAYRDGTLFADRGDFASAAGSFKLAAGDSEARPLVAAAARLRAAEALLAWGASDPTRYAEAAETAARFLSDNADNREVPQAQMVQARALLLSGKPAESALVYRALFGKLAGDAAAAGYSRAQCFRAGLLAARALLAANDTLGARELFSSLTNTLGPLVAGLDAAATDRASLASTLDEAGLGEGYAELVAGNTAQALTFFQNKRAALTAESSSSLRYGTLLGLGECLLVTGKPREAQLALAEVSAMEPSDRDRTARAMLLLAQASITLGDVSERHKPLLEALIERYGDTPSAGQAVKLLGR